MTYITLHTTHKMVHVKLVREINYSELTVLFHHIRSIELHHYMDGRTIGRMVVRVDIRMAYWLIGD